MRGGRSLLILFVLALALGAYIYYDATRAPAPADERDQVFSIETGTIQELEVKAEDGATTELRRNGEEWRIAAPIDASADQAAVRAIVSALETLEIQRTIADNPPSVAVFGLDPARIAVSFTPADGEATRRLQIGNRTATGSDLYARVEGEPRVFLVSAYLENTFGRSTFELRDKTVLAFPRGEVDAITLAPAASPTVTLSRTGNSWRLTAPAAARADWTPVDGLVNRLAEARMTGIEPLAGPEPSAAELRRFGLDAPRLVATLGAGSATATLALGADAVNSEGDVYARDLSRPLVFTVPASLLTDLQKQPEDLRVKDVFEFKSFSILGLTVERGGMTQSFVRSTTPASDTAPAADSWRQTAPEERETNLTAMTDLLNTLSSLRAVSFADRAPTSGEDTVVIARFGDAAAPTEERVTFRRSGTTVHAIRADEPGAAVVPTDEFDKALGQLDAIVSGQ